MSLANANLGFQMAAPAPQAGERDAAALQPSLYRIYIRYTPAFWLLGALTIFASAMLVILSVRRWPRTLVANLVIASWCSIGAMQAVASILNGVIQSDIALGLRNACSLSVLGWIFGGFAIASGAGWQLANREWARETARLSVYLLVFAILAALLRGVGFTEMVWFRTPASYLFPGGGRAATFYTAVSLFQSEDTLGEARTRLIMFFPWAPALGLGALSYFLIGSRASGAATRLVGALGSIIGVVFSWSRIAIAGLVVTVAVLFFFRMPRRTQIVLVLMLFAAVGAALASGANPAALLLDARAQVDDARQGSSMARDLIYARSWEGFLTSPLIGKGWIGDSVHPTEILPIGSHSSVYGLLYTGGILTFSAFVVAMLTTLAALLVTLRRVKGDPERERDVHVALCLWLSLALYCPYESLFSLTVPCLPLFVWIGGVLGSDASKIGEFGKAAVSKPIGRVPRLFAPDAKQRTDALSKQNLWRGAERIPPQRSRQRVFNA